MNTPTIKSADEKYCRDCAAVIKAAAEICPMCGCRQMAPPPAAPLPVTSGPSRTVAGLLALVLGGLGIHRFYLGHFFRGMLYLLLCWTFIPMVFGFIEALYFFSGFTDDEFAQEYGKRAERS